MTIFTTHSIQQVFLQTCVCKVFRVVLKCDLPFQILSIRKCYVVCKFTYNFLWLNQNNIQEIFGALRITAHPSGYSIGSCNWTIQSDFEKVKIIAFFLCFQKVLAIN